tara:strand:+ start:1267 stop:1707 length:441 start_codon:yes stop_codon:yes gene_type:complete
MEFNFMGVKISLVNIVVGLLLGMLMSSSIFCSCSKFNIKEGFEMIGSEIGFNMSHGVPGDKWSNNPGSNIDTDYENNIYSPLKDNIGGEVPLPEGKMSFFYANKFDPACCFKPQQYSSGKGCPCISVKQMKYLNERAGNNTSFADN